MARFVKEKIKNILHNDRTSPASAPGQDTTTNVPEAFYLGSRPVAPQETHHTYPYSSSLGQVKAPVPPTQQPRDLSSPGDPTDKEGEDIEDLLAGPSKEPSEPEKEIPEVTDEGGPPYDTTTGLSPSEEATLPRSDSEEENLKHHHFAADKWTDEGGPPTDEGGPPYETTTGLSPTEEALLDPPEPAVETPEQEEEKSEADEKSPEGGESEETPEQVDEEKSEADEKSPEGGESQETVAPPTETSPEEEKSSDRSGPVEGKTDAPSSDKNNWLFNMFNNSKPETKPEEIPSTTEGDTKE